MCTTGSGSGVKVVSPALDGSDVLPAWWARRATVDFFDEGPGGTVRLFAVLEHVSC